MVLDVLDPGPPSHTMLVRAVKRLARTWTWRVANERLHHVLPQHPTEDNPAEDLWTAYRVGFAADSESKPYIAGLSRRQVAAFERGRKHQTRGGRPKTAILPADKPVFVQQVLRGKYEDLMSAKGWPPATGSIKALMAEHFLEAAWEPVVTGYIAGWTSAPFTVKGHRSLVLVGCAFGHQARLNYDKMQEA